MRDAYLMSVALNSPKVLPRNNNRPMIQVFWDVTPSCTKRVASLLRGYQSMKNEPHAVPKRQSLYQSTWRNIPEDILLQHCCENLTPRTSTVRKFYNHRTKTADPVSSVFFLLQCKIKLAIWYFPHFRHNAPPPKPTG